ncbi:PREDICTED: putative F-box protein PP2-B12 isoform X4 [Ipomoea nil]|uniref:putative F-box protein PP2-B12 isoform X4 n=1 Tax=Ipomoea nil TaxID=35883 RepID=UPI000900957E|nr:PREDICTED: putative F-box protein PP2-B12 isoform X4 [Ipomoea nil]
MDYFAHLPEGCISEILSLTSPEDTARLSATSKGFKAAAESDSVWNRFLPPDLTDIISRSASPVVYSNKKELYFTLCNSPILLDDGAKLSFSLDRRSGKKCFMIAARQLDIIWGNEDHCCQWASLADSRFSEVAVIRRIIWFDIRGKIATKMLSETTNYAVYLVFRFAGSAYGLQSSRALVRLVSRESNEEDAQNGADNLVNLFIGGVRRQERSDGWMEVEMGSFYNDAGDDGDVEAQFIELWPFRWERGLIVQGFEFRPK